MKTEQEIIDYINIILKEQSKVNSSEDIDYINAKTKELNIVRNTLEWVLDKD